MKVCTPVECSSLEKGTEFSDTPWRTHKTQTSWKVLKQGGAMHHQLCETFGFLAQISQPISRTYNMVMSAWSKGCDPRSVFSSGANVMVCFLGHLTYIFWQMKKWNKWRTFTTNRHFMLCQGSSFAKHGVLLLQHLSWPMARLGRGFLVWKQRDMSISSVSKCYESKLCTSPTPRFLPKHEPSVFVDPELPPILCS